MTKWSSNFYENALSWAHIGRLDHSGDVSFGYFSQRARPAWIVEWRSALSYIGDAIFHLHKDIWTMIYTQPVTRTKVLIYPYAHGFHGIAYVALVCGP